MKKTSETVVFFGSGPVAAESLRLLAQNFKIEAVITKPRPPHHHGAVPVLEVAKQLKIDSYTASNRVKLDQLFTGAAFRSRLGVLIDFGIIVSKKVIDYFPLGIVNSHFSILPEWRGADPITFSILSGQKETGVSLMLLVEAMDEGPLLAQAPLKLSGHMTTPELTASLIELSDSALQAVLPLYIDSKTQPAPQEQAALPGHTIPTYSRKLTKQDGIIDWHKPAERLEREVRAFIEWPKSRTTLAGKEVIITKAHVEQSSHGEIGQVIKEAGIIKVCTDNGSLVIERLKPAGKPEMSATAFLAGYGQGL